MKIRDYGWITARELAYVLNLPIQSVWKLTREQAIPAYKVSGGYGERDNLGNHYRYDLNKVLNVMRGNEDNSPKNRAGFLI